MAAEHRYSSCDGALGSQYWASANFGTVPSNVSPTPYHPLAVSYFSCPNGMSSTILSTGVDARGNLTLALAPMQSNLCMAQGLVKSLVDYVACPLQSYVRWQANAALLPPHDKLSSIHPLAQCHRRPLDLASQFSCERATFPTPSFNISHPDDGSTDCQSCGWNTYSFQSGSSLSAFEVYDADTSDSSSSHSSLFGQFQHQPCLEAATSSKSCDISPSVVPLNNGLWSVPTLGSHDPAQNVNHAEHVSARAVSYNVGIGISNPTAAQLLPKCGADALYRPYFDDAALDSNGFCETINPSSIRATVDDSDTVSSPTQVSRCQSLASDMSSHTEPDTGMVEQHEDEAVETPFEKKQKSLAKRARRAARVPPKTPEQEAKDKLLLDMRNQGLSYREIKRRGKFRETESTLRGRIRMLSRPLHERVRKPDWTRRDIALLEDAVVELEEEGGRRRKIPWSLVADSVRNNGGSYPFGSGTCSRKWAELKQSNA